MHVVSIQIQSTFYDLWIYLLVSANGFDISFNRFRTQFQLVQAYLPRLALPR